VAFLLTALVAGCASRGSAPVIDRTSPTGRPSSAPAAPPGAPAASAPASRGLDASSETYTVRRGDTLYGIALDSGQNYRDIAEWNNLSNPNVIREGQVLRLTPPGGVQTRPIEARGNVESRPLDGSAAGRQASSAQAARETVKTEPRAVKLPYTDENYARLAAEKPPAAAAQPAPTAPAAQPPAQQQAAAKPPAPESKPAAQPAADVEDDDKIDWGWPTVGRVIAGFSEAANKGLDIGGKAGQPVVASAAGTVLYVGSGIRGYGKLIVVRHTKSISSVYAHNSEVVVKEGQRVAKGQKIAEMGNSDADQVKLHFEIRRLGKPTDPAKLLPERAG
jgi:lipoprotein NlpD